MPTSAEYTRTTFENKEYVLGAKISAVIITYNEEYNLPRTLNQLTWCDEIVVVDSLSTDGTVKICEQYGCKVFTRPFDGYGTQKRFAIEQASNDWILFMDADEVLTDELVLEILDTFKAGTSLQQYAGYSMPTHLVFLGKEFKHGKESRRQFVRLFNKQKGSFTANAVHEKIELDGPVKKFKHPFLHYSYRNVQHYLEKGNKYTSLAADIALKKGKNKSMLAVIFIFPINFFRYYILEGNWLNGVKGFYWALFSAHYHFTRYVKIREINEERHNQA